MINLNIAHLKDFEIQFQTKERYSFKYGQSAKWIRYNRIILTVTFFKQLLSYELLQTKIISKAFSTSISVNLHEWKT